MENPKRYADKIKRTESENTSGLQIPAGSYNMMDSLSIIKPHFQPLFKSHIKSIHNTTQQIKPKLEISQPDDASEMQADEIADSFMEGDAEHSQEILSQHTTEISRSGDDNAMQTSDAFDQQLQQTKGQGQKLDEATRSELETHTGTDLSGVNIHTDAKAHALSESINAKAFAHGHDIYFKEGNYNPQSEEGKSLLAHEVAHTVQGGLGVMGMMGKVQRFPDSDTGNFVVTFMGKVSEEENGKITYYYQYEIAYKKSFSYDDFMLLFLQDVFSLDDATTELLINDIKARQAKRNQTYQQYWERGTFAGVTYTNTKGEPQNQPVKIAESEYYNLLAFLGLPVPAKTEEYSSTMQDILNSDPGKLPVEEQENRKKLMALIKMISPDEWGLGKGLTMYGMPDEFMIEQIEAYIKYRRKVWRTLQSAVDKNDALLAATTINTATDQVLVSFTLDQRLAYIRLIANGKEIVEGDLAILKLLQTAPEGQLLGLLNGLAANKSELLVLLNTTMSDKMADYMNVLRAMTLYAKSDEMLSLLISGASGKPDAKKIFPWDKSTSTLKNMIMPGWEFDYKSSIGSEGKVSLEYEWFTTTTYYLNSPFNATAPSTPIVEYHLARDQDPLAANDPEKYGIAELDPFELIMLEVRTSSSRVGFQEGQRFIVPAIMMPYIVDEVNWETIVKALNFTANAVLFAVGVGEVIAAKNAIQVIVGVVNALVGAVGMVRPEIEKLNGGKDFLAYYDVFVLLQASYYGGKLLLKLPELYAGVVKTWQMVKLANAGDQALLKLGTLSTEVGSLDAQLKAYVEALDSSKRANAQWRIAMEETKLELRLGNKLLAFDAILGPIGVVAGLIGKGIQLGFLRARATIAEIRTYLEMRGVFKELGAMTTKEIDDLIAKAQAQAVATEVNAMKQTVQGLGRVRSGKPNYAEWQPLNDEEIVVFTKNPDSTNAFLVRTENGKDLVTYGTVPTPRPSKSVSMGVTLEVDEEVSSIFSRKNGLAEPGDVLYATTVRQVRGAGFDVIYHPTPNNNWHASIVEKTTEKAAKFAIPDDVNKLRQTFILIQKK